MIKSNRVYCSWGMYAFTEVLQNAWRCLFEKLAPALGDSYLLNPQLRFATDELTLRSPNLLIGQTCGYPLIKFYREDLAPSCVPAFRVDGCEGALYRSAIITSVNSDIYSLADCAGKTVAINGPESNSGMNLLRAEVIKLSPDAPFFSSTLVSGSHNESIKAVSERRADVAAIDCVTFALTQAAMPSLTETVRVIAYTGPCAGLPFVVPAARRDSLPSERVTELMNTALAAMPPLHRTVLPIESFAPVSMEDYYSIEEMEKTALRLGRDPLAL